MMDCKHCGFELADTAKFCNSCGKSKGARIDPTFDVDTYRNKQELQMNTAIETNAQTHLYTAYILRSLREVVISNGTTRLLSQYDDLLKEEEQKAGILKITPCEQFASYIALLVLGLFVLFPWGYGVYKIFT
jgi:hypothetical protein